MCAIPRKQTVHRTPSDFSYHARELKRPKYHDTNAPSFAHLYKTELVGGDVKSIDVAGKPSVRLLGTIGPENDKKRQRGCSQNIGNMGFTNLMRVLILMVSIS